MKLVTAIKITVFWRGNLSKIKPNGISVKIIGTLVEIKPVEFNRS